MALSKMYGLADVSNILGVTRRTILDYIHDGKLKAVKIGGAWKVTEAALKTFTEKGMTCNRGKKTPKGLKIGETWKAQEEQPEGGNELH